MSAPFWRFVQELEAMEDTEDMLAAPAYAEMADAIEACDAACGRPALRAEPALRPGCAGWCWLEAEGMYVFDSVNEMFDAAAALAWPGSPQQRMVQRCVARVQCWLDARELEGELGARAAV